MRDDGGGSWRQQIATIPQITIAAAVTPMSSYAHSGRPPDPEELDVVELDSEELFSFAVLGARPPGRLRCATSTRQVPENLTSRFSTKAPASEAGGRLNHRCESQRNTSSGEQQSITRSTPARLYQLRSEIKTLRAAGRCGGPSRTTDSCSRSNSPWRRASWLTASALGSLLRCRCVALVLRSILETEAGVSCHPDQLMRFRPFGQQWVGDGLGLGIGFATSSQGDLEAGCDPRGAVRGVGSPGRAAPSSPN